MCGTGSPAFSVGVCEPVKGCTRMRVRFKGTRQDTWLMSLGTTELPYWIATGSEMLRGHGSALSVGCPSRMLIRTWQRVSSLVYDKG